MRSKADCHVLSCCIQNSPVPSTAQLWCQVNHAWLSLLLGKVVSQKTLRSFSEMDTSLAFPFLISTDE